MFGFLRRDRTRQTVGRHISSGTLANSFDRRSLVIGGIQGGIGLLLAVRMGWIAVAENERYQMLAITCQSLP